MILSIIVIDKNIYSKPKKEFDDKTYNLAEQMEIFEIDKSSGKSNSMGSYN